MHMYNVCGHKHMHVCLTWEDVNISVLGHIGLVSRISNTCWSGCDTLHMSGGITDSILDTDWGYCSTNEQ